MSRRFIYLQGSFNIFLSENSLCFNSFIRNQSFEINVSSLNKEFIIRLQEMLIKGAYYSEFKSCFKQYNLDKNFLDKLINNLHSKDIIIEKTSQVNLDLYPEKFNRLIRYFNTFETSSTSGLDYFEKLKNSKVAFVGLGSYGSELVIQLSRLGLKEVWGTDFDTVEMTNLDRQLIYRESDIGEKKSIAAYNFIDRLETETEYIFERIKIRDVDSFPSKLKSYDFLINTFGFLPYNHHAYNTSKAIVSFAQINNIPLLTISGNWVGPLTTSKSAKCYWCFHNKVLQNNTWSPSTRAAISSKRMFLPMNSILIGNAISDMIGNLTGAYEAKSENHMRRVDNFYGNEDRIDDLSIEFCSTCKKKGNNDK